MDINSKNVMNTLSDDQKNALVELALQSAENVGYCSETNNVLEYMGFDVSEKPVEVQLKVEVLLPFGVSVNTNDGYVILYGSDGEEYEAQILDGIVT